MDPILRGMFEQAISQLSQRPFQSFGEKLFLKYYKNRFEVLKDKRDEGCDGIIDNKIIVAMYSPENYNLAKFKKKVTGDFESYSVSWKKDYPDWIFVYGGKITAQGRKHLDKYIKTSTPLSIDNLLEMISELNWNEIMDLARELKMNLEIIPYSVLRCIVEDLSKDKYAENILSEKAIYIEDKIKINFKKNDIDSITEEYEKILPEITKLGKVLAEYSEKDNLALMNKILKNYNLLSGDFKNRMNDLTRILSEAHEEDDMYCFYVRVIVMYLFERCLIGKKTEEEKNVNAIA